MPPSPRSRLSPVADLAQMAHGIESASIYPHEVVPGLHGR